MRSVLVSRRFFASSTTGNAPITVARGDGIGPEITDATMRILEAAKARVSPQNIVVGESLYLKGGSFSSFCVLIF
jgi:isocitrate dehydrogenase